MSELRLLYVEDEADLLEITAKRLRSEGHRVDACADGLEAQAFIETTEYDAIILDIMLPKQDGLSLLLQIRADGVKTPVLLLTARDSVADRVRGLDLGADDYLVKPFSFLELTARIRALARRQPLEKTDNRFVVADLELDLASRTVQRGGKLIQLTQREFALLEVLIRHAGTVLTRGQIEQHIYDFGFEGDSNVIDVYIRYLRKKIDQDQKVKLIQTVRGAGYVLREEN